MAARKKKTSLNSAWREKIQASMIVNRLKDHGDGKIELAASQIKSYEVILDRLEPKLSSVEQTTHVDHIPTQEELDKLMTEAINNLTEDQLRKHGLTRLRVAA